MDTLVNFSFQSSSNKTHQERTTSPEEPGTPNSLFDGTLSPPPSDFDSSDKEFDFELDVESLDSFIPVERIDVTAAGITEEEIISRVHTHVIKSGLPLVLTNCHKLPEFNQNLFSPTWLRSNKGNRRIEARDILNRNDCEMTVSDYFNYVEEACSHPTQEILQILYGKDIVCPRDWKTQVAKMLPEYFIYHGSNDLATSLASRDRAKSMMAYIGIEGTRTPAHKDICGTIGHNLMVYADTDRDSYSIWYMVSSESKKIIEELFKENGENLDLENFFAPEQVLAQAKCTVYLVEQRVGDFVLVPSEGAHQVVNYGGCTIKVAWNRSVVKTVKTAIESVLPVYRRICRPEVYKISRLLVETIRSWIFHLKKAEKEKTGTTTTTSIINPLKTYGVRDIQAEFITLVELYRKLLKEEWVDSDVWDPADASDEPASASSQIRVGHEKKTYSIRCDYCQRDIFNRFFRCDQCEVIPPGCDSDDNATYDLCCSCYARGRSCHHQMEPFESFTSDELESIYNDARLMCRKVWGANVPSLDRHESSVVMTAIRRWKNWVKKPIALPSSGPFYETPQVPRVK